MCLKPSDKARHLFLKYGDRAVDVVRDIIDALESFGYSGAMYDDFETGGITTTDEKNPTRYWYEILDYLQNK